MAATLDITLSVSPPHASMSEADIDELEELKHALETELTDVRVDIAVRVTPPGSIGLFVSPEELIIKIIEGAATATGAYAMRRTLETVDRWRATRRNRCPVNVLDEQGREIELDAEDQTPSDLKPQL